ncbi:hypothetical protein HK407_02g02520 [Ordospora pajunii]|uniref:uncharacterized protein n=1 Tax=Ordospora pajunii TaxID=3039483 RepID=UPI002952838D|nr:uncharacterized protein HK407_02g02520 [Ordospora pajunii]KAH9412101.1 hypothetical protein HK407_02g02520 [Ordospora pajunii]
MLCIDNLLINFYIQMRICIPMTEQQHNHSNRNNESIGSNHTENMEHLRHRHNVDSDTDVSGTSAITGNAADSSNTHTGSIYALGNTIYNTMCAHTHTAQHYTLRYIHKCMQSIRECMHNIRYVSVPADGSQSIPLHIPRSMLYAVANRAIPDIALAVAVHQVCVLLRIVSVANAAAVIVNVMSFVLPLVNAVYVVYVSVNSMARVRSNEIITADASNDTASANTHAMIMIRNIPILPVTLIVITIMYISIHNSTRNIEPMLIGLMAMQCMCSQCIIVFGGDVSNTTAVGVLICTVLYTAGMGISKRAISSNTSSSNAVVSRLVANAGTIGKCIAMASGLAMIMIVKHSIHTDMRSQ